MSSTTQREKEQAAALGFGHQGEKQKTVRFSETEFRTEVNNAKLHVSIRVPEHQQMSPLCEKYGVGKYNLHPNYVFPESFTSLIPRNTPDFVDRGEKYVERIIRALYYFRQCALIGPSGTGKTHIVYIVAETAACQCTKSTVDSRPQRTICSEDTLGWAKRTGLMVKSYHGAGTAASCTLMKQT